MTCSDLANDSISVEYANRPARTFRLMTSAKFFSKKGTLPCAISTMRELSGWQQVTGGPKSARQAETTVPRYPDPYSPIYIMLPACHATWNPPGNRDLGSNPTAYVLSAEELGNTREA